VSQVESSTKASTSAPKPVHSGGGTLFIAIGIQQLECAVRHRGRWVPDSFRAVPVAPVPPALPVAERAAVALVVAAPSAKQAALQTAPQTATQAVITALQALQVELPKLGRIAQVRVLIADAYLAVNTVPWSANLERADTAAGFVRLQLQEAGFDVALADVLVMDDAPHGSPRLVVAYSAVLLAALTQFAQQVQAPLTSVLPWSVLAWQVVQQTARREHALSLLALAVLDDDLVLLARSPAAGSRRFNELTVRSGGNAATGVTSAQMLNKLWQRCCLRDESCAALTELLVLDLRTTADALDPSDALHKPFVSFVSLSAPQTSAPTVSLRLRLLAHSRGARHVLDAAPRAAAVSPWRWVVLAAALVAASALVWHAWQQQRSVQSLEAKINARRLTPPPPNTPLSAAKWSREELARAHAVNAAVNTLNLPMAALLNALQAPDNIQVAILNVDFGGVAVNSSNALTAAPSASNTPTASIKVQAEARSSADMARYIAWVAERKPFFAAYLVSHDVPMTATNDQPSLVTNAAERPYRFTMEAQWSD
jgi:hypothetical protein